MAKTLVAHEEPVLKVFSDAYVFRIPDYQRPYSWTTVQARELIDDLLGFIQANPGDVASMPTYFLGSIVLIKLDTPDADVVDGQQRLTTLTLLLSAIRARSSKEVRALLTKRIYEEGDFLVGATERLLSGGGATYDYSVITVEHVLPQNPRSGSKWLEWFPDPVVRSSVVDRIGNLALLTRKKNSQASNWDFDRKKNSYFKKDDVSPFVLTTQVIDIDSWEWSVVEERQANLMGIFEKHWRLGKV